MLDISFGAYSVPIIYVWESIIHTLWIGLCCFASFFFLYYYYFMFVKRMHGTPYPLSVIQFGTFGMSHIIHSYFKTAERMNMGEINWLRRILEINKFDVYSRVWDLSFIKNAKEKTNERICNHEMCFLKHATIEQCVFFHLVHSYTVQGLICRWWFLIYFWIWAHAIRNHHVH